MALTVKQLARSAGIAPPTVRYYDRIGLLCAEERSDAGYRLYSPADEGRLRFIRRAKLLGRLLDHKLLEIDAQIAELGALRERLVSYRAGSRTEPRSGCCHGDFCGCLDDVPDP